LTLGYRWQVRSELEGCDDANTRNNNGTYTGHERRGKLSSLIDLIRTTSRRILARVSTNQRPEKGDLMAGGSQVRSELEGCGDANTRNNNGTYTCHERGGKSSFSIALIRTTGRRIPARVSTNQGP